jgi:hypothetical protein
MISRMQTNVILSIEGADWLDGQSLAIRRTRGKFVRRTGLLRGIVAGLMKAGLDFSCCRTEGDVESMLAFLLEAFSKRSGGDRNASQ